MKNNFYRKKLKNGMNVLFEERKNSGVVSLAFFVKIGAVHENIKERGISHFIEHMLFKGTKKRNSKKLSEAIEKKGGNLNGETGEEVIFYTCKMPCSKIKIALDVLSDMIKNPLFDKTEIEKERKVIFEEMKIYKDNPRLYIQDNMNSCLFKGSLGMSPAGTEKILSSINKTKLVKKFKEIYTSDNLNLCVVGEANFKKLCGFCEKSFQNSRGFINEPKIEKINKISIVKRKGIDQANLMFAFHVPKANEKGYYAAQVLSCLMAGGMSSRLWQEIREKRNLAYGVHGSCNSGKKFGYNYIQVGCLPENVNFVKKIILEEFAKLKNLKNKELNQVKEQLIGNSKISREDSQGEMIDLIYNEIWSKAEKAYEYEKEIKKVKLEDVKKLASKVKKGKYSFLALVPDKK